VSEFSQPEVKVLQDPISVYPQVDCILDSAQNIPDQCKTVRVQVQRTIQQARIVVV